MGAPWLLTSQLHPPQVLHHHPFPAGTHHNPYVLISPAPGSAGKTRGGYDPQLIESMGEMFEHATKKAESLAENVWHHLKTSPSVTDAALGRLAKGIKVLTEGGHEESFQQTFGIFPIEKLLKTYACYLSTFSGPVIGTLYISKKYSLLHCVTILPQDKRSGYITRLNHSEKYIQIITRGGHEFWFIGFVTYEKALKNLTEASQHSRTTC